jgi:hypothetical protein
MASPFDKISVPDSIKTELEARQGKNGILWTAQRFPWMSLTSLSNICDSKYKTLESSKGALYEEGYVRPLPVVTQIDVRKKGNLGTTKQVTINITAFTDAQLIELQKCYFIPGLSVRAEWGWSIQAKNLKPTSGPISKDFKLDCLAIPKIIGQEQTDTSYCGVQGVVGNFSYSLTRDNYWECVLEITGVAEAFASAPINEAYCDCPTKIQKENSKEVVSNSSSPFLVALTNIFNNVKSSRQDYVNQLAPLVRTQNPDIAVPSIKELRYDGTIRHVGGAEKSLFSSDFFEVLLNAGGIKDVYEPYINLHTLELLANLFFSKSGKSESNSNTKCGTSTDLGVMNSADTLIKYDSLIMSVDPRVCIVPGMVDQVRVFPDGTTTLNSKTAVVEKDNQKYIQLYNIVVNVAAVYQAYQSVAGSTEPTIDSFFRNVLSRINDACGNPWDFEIVSNTLNKNKDQKAPTELTIIDLNVRPKGKDTKAYALPAKVNNSVLRDLSIETKLMESMKTQAIYATNSDINKQKDGTDKCAQQNFKAFILSDTQQVNEGKEYQKPQNPDPKCTVCEKNKDEALLEKDTYFYLKQVGLEVEDETVAAAKEALIKDYNNTDNNSPINCDGTPLPFTLKFSLDGIGGFRFGQMVTCDRLPVQITNEFEYQITSVNHTITPNDWVTSIETVPRPKPTPNTNTQERKRRTIETAPTTTPVQQEIKQIVKNAGGGTSAIDVYKVDKRGRLTGRETGGGI